MTSPCPRCQIRLSPCLCGWLTTRPSPLKLLFWQHPDEQGHALNTALLAQQQLQGSELWVSEQAPALDGEPPFLLFPGPDSLDPGDPALTESIYRRGVIILDGSWRKAKRLIHLNPDVQSLPRLGLQPQQPSRLWLRKGPGGSALSTLEATLELLIALGESSDYRQLLDAQDALQARQWAHMPQTVRQHYRTRLSASAWEHLQLLAIHWNSNRQ